MDLSFALLLLTASGQGRAGRDQAGPADRYATIDVTLAVETEDALRRGAEDARRRAVDAVLAAPQRYAPPVLHALARVLAERGDREAAAFWFHAGALRARFDASRCADPSAGGILPALGRELGEQMGRQAREDLPRHEALLARVLAWDRETPHAYDHRWISVFGALALRAGPPRSAPRPAAQSLPAERWRELAEEVRRRYLDEVRSSVAQVGRGAGADAQAEGRLHDGRAHGLEACAGPGRVTP